MKQRTTRIILVGTGKFAEAIARTFPEKIFAVVGRNAERVDALALLSSARPVEGLVLPEDSEYDALWIVTADGVLADVAEQLAVQRESWAGTAVLHSSGATSVDVLEPFLRRGGVTFALHPNGSFTGAEPIPADLLWTVEPSGTERVSRAERLLEGLPCDLVPLSEGIRPLYHAAAVFSANFTIALFAEAVRLYGQAGFTTEQAMKVVENFMSTAVRRAASQGAASVMTGPVSRADFNVVEAHIRTLQSTAPDLVELYAELALSTARVAGDDGAEEKWGRFLERIRRR